MSKRIFKKSIASIFVAVILIVTLTFSLSGVGTDTMEEMRTLSIRFQFLRVATPPVRYISNSGRNVDGNAEKFSSI